jgi:hypothetical protein
MSSFFGSLFSKAVPLITKGLALGKQFLPSVANAVGKVQQAISTAKAVGKTVKDVAQSVAPELVQKVEESKAFNIGKALLGKTEGVLDLVGGNVGRAEGILDKVSGYLG